MIADVDRQIVVDGTFGDALQTFDADVADGEVGIVRWRLRQRAATGAQCVNRATEARTARAFMLHSPMTFFRARMRAVGFRARSLGRSTELACDVVEQCDTHQQDEQRNTDLLSERLRPLGQRAALQPLDELKDDLPAVENRDGQQVEKSQRQRNQHQELRNEATPASAESPAYSAIDSGPFRFFIENWPSTMRQNRRPCSAVMLQASSAARLSAAPGTAAICRIMLSGNLIAGGLRDADTADELVAALLARTGIRTVCSTAAADVGQRQRLAGMAR